MDSYSKSLCKPTSKTSSISGARSGAEMARSINRLSVLQVKNETKPGRHADGNGLYLSISRNGGKRWVFLYNRLGRRREMGLGSARVIPLVKARQLAAQATQTLSDGDDPIIARRTSESKTFGQCADEFISVMEPSWKNDKHVAQWRMTLREYAAPIRHLAVQDIDTEAVMRVLKPMWREKPETAYRLMGRIERVLSAAKAQGLRKGENPARWRGHLDNLLPPRAKLSRGHHKALPYEDIPEFMKRLRSRFGSATIALEFTILTAVRSGETMNATWSEIHFDDSLWVIPAERMKAGIEHRVPLTSRCMTLLEQASELRNGQLIFPGNKPGSSLSTNSMSAVLKRMQLDCTVHGFRSSFRDWAAEQTEYAGEVCEMALAHTIRNQTERAYRRGDLLERRASLMNDWSNYCGPEKRNGEN